MSEKKYYGDEAYFVRPEETRTPLKEQLSEAIYHLGKWALSSFVAAALVTSPVIKDDLEGYPHSDGLMHSESIADNIYGGAAKTVEFIIPGPDTIAELKGEDTQNPFDMHEISQP